jgi:hypothetical protein
MRSLMKRAKKLFDPTADGVVRGAGIAGFIIVFVGLFVDNVPGYANFVALGSCAVIGGAYTARQFYHKIRLKEETAKTEREMAEESARVNQEKTDLALESLALTRQLMEDQKKSKGRIAQVSQRSAERSASHHHGAGLGLDEEQEEIKPLSSSTSSKRRNLNFTVASGSSPTTLSLRLSKKMPTRAFALHSQLMNAAQLKHSQDDSPVEKVSQHSPGGLSSPGLFKTSHSLESVALASGTTTTDVTPNTTPDLDQKPDKKVNSSPTYSRQLHS